MKTILGVLGGLASITAIIGLLITLNIIHPFPNSTPAEADVIVCLTDARFVADPNPAPDHGVVEPVYLQTTLNLRNKGSASATVTDIYIDYLGIYLSNGQSIHTMRTYQLNSPLTIAANGVTSGIILDQLIDQRAETRLESAQTRADWEGGTGKTFNPTFDGVSWQNDPACSS